MTDRPPQVLAVLGRGVVPADEAVVLADDLGLTRGDGCFDAARLVMGGDGTWRIDHLEAHLARFAGSCRRLDLPEPDEAAWRALIAEAVAAWGRPGEGVVKLIATRGPEHLLGGATGLVTIVANGPSCYPIDVVTLDRGYASDAFAGAPWLMGGVKVLSYAINVAAKRVAASRGAHDALFVSADGFCLEGPTSGFLARFGAGWVTTPVGATGILPSCTLGALRDGLAAEGVRVDDRLVRPTDLADADGAWLVSAGRGVCEIATLDGVRLRQDAATTARLVRLAGFDR